MVQGQLIDAVGHPQKQIEGYSSAFGFGFDLQPPKTAGGRRCEIDFPVLDAGAAELLVRDQRRIVLVKEKVYGDIFVCRKGVLDVVLALGRFQIGLVFAFAVGFGSFAFVFFGRAGLFTAGFFICGCAFHKARLKNIFLAV